jgi:hypothetical protein
MRATIRALKFAMSWGLATAELHREPESIEELAAVMELSRATAFRDQQAFRKCFPTEPTPGHLNQTSGQQDRYNELLRQLGDIKSASSAAESTVFNLGAGSIPA